MVGSRAWRRRRPDLQAITLQSCEELKKENLGTGMGDVERRMINCSIPLILIGHYANNGGTMDGDTYLPQLHWEIFWGYLSANNGTKASKQKLKTNTLQSSLSILLGELVGFLMPSVYGLFAQTLSISTNTAAWGGLRFGISLRPLFVIFKSYQVTKQLRLFEQRAQMFHLGREQASMKPMNGGVDWVKLLLVLQNAFNAFFRLEWSFELSIEPPCVTVLGFCNV